MVMLYFFKKYVVKNVLSILIILISFLLPGYLLYLFILKERLPQHVLPAQMNGV
jgi:hypothetical protein